MKMLMSDFEVSLVNDSMQEFFVRFHGPKDSTASDNNSAVRRRHLENPRGAARRMPCLMQQYPYKSPSIGFMNKIFHPNIDELSGSVCLDVINQTWSPMFGIVWVI